ncbi:unnamed protein product [Camellia sinensis]
MEKNQFLGQFFYLFLAQDGSPGLLRPNDSPPKVTHGPFLFPTDKTLERLTSLFDAELRGPSSQCLVVPCCWNLLRGPSYSLRGPRRRALWSLPVVWSSLLAPAILFEVVHYQTNFK